MAQFDLPSVPHFDPHESSAGSQKQSQSWKKWLRSFELYATARGVSDKEQRRALLLHCAGVEVQDIFFSLDEKEGADVYEKVQKTLTEYFQTKVNVPYERYLFRSLSQDENDTVAEFVTCEFDRIDEQIRDQVIAKCRSHALRAKLLEKGHDLTLSQLRTIATTVEMIDVQAKSTSEETASVSGAGMRASNARVGPGSSSRGPHTSTAGKFHQEAMDTEETSQINMQTVNHLNTVAMANTGPATNAPTTSGQTHQLPHTTYIPNPSGMTSNAYAQPAGASTHSNPDVNGCAAMEMSHRSHEEVPTAVVPPSSRPNSSIGQLRSGAPPTPAPVSEPRTAQHAASSSARPQLPESHEFKVTVNFLNVQMLEETVIEPNGCVLFYKHPDQPTMLATPRDNMKKVAITTFITKEKDGTIVEETQKKYTEMILNSFDKGVSLYSRDLNLYAKRHCDMKLFWTSTESCGNVVHAEALVRETETEIFNWQRFEDDLKKAFCNGKQKEVRLPAVRFSFAQKWDTSSCPLNTKLVSARVEPLKAGEMIRWVNPDVQPASHYDSFHTSLFQWSHTSSNMSSTN